MRKNPNVGACLLGLVGAVSACAMNSDEEASTEASGAALTAAVGGTDVRRSLVVTDAAVLAKFSFQRTMDAIRTSANVAESQRPSTSTGAGSKPSVRRPLLAIASAHRSHRKTFSIERPHKPARVATRYRKLHTQNWGVVCAGRDRLRLCKSMSNRTSPKL